MIEGKKIDERKKDRRKKDRRKKDRRKKIDIPIDLQILMYSYDIT